MSKRRKPAVEAFDKEGDQNVPEGYTWCPNCQGSYQGEVCPGCFNPFAGGHPLPPEGAKEAEPEPRPEGCPACNTVAPGGTIPSTDDGKCLQCGRDLTPTTLAEVAEPALKNLNDRQEAVKTAELNVKTRNTTESLKCILTDDEIRRYGIAQARANAEIATAEEELQSVKSQYKSRVDAATATRNDMAKRINNGYEFRQVDCQERWNYGSNIITVFRTDTYETVSRRTMSREEMQRKLF